MIYAVGDIHGQVTMLRALLECLREQPLRPEDTLVFLGDYIDRGEDSCAVIETLLELRAQHNDTIFLRGNHEQMMLAARDGTPPKYLAEQDALELSEVFQIWLANGGVEALNSYGLTWSVEDLPRWWETIPEAHWTFLRDTQMEYITERYHFVHAGILPPGARWDEEGIASDPRLWIREPFLSGRADFGGRIVVFGHTPQQSGRPLLKKNKIGLDTGAVFGGPLTAAAFDLDAPAHQYLPVRLFQAEHTVAAPLEIEP